MRCRNDVHPQSPGMKYPKKEYAQGVRPAHILFSEFLVLEDAGVLPAKLKLGTDIKDTVCVIIK